MRYITDLKNFNIEGSSVVAIGKFVGIHLGHQKLIKKLVEEKNRMGDNYEAVLFVISGITEKIIGDDERRAKLERLGIGTVIECDFNDELRTMSRETFLDKILIGRLHAKNIVAGPDVKFGYKGAGDAAFLREEAAKKGFELTLIEKEQYRGEDISSTRIKDCIAAGNKEDAEAMLGR